MDSRLPAHLEVSGLIRAAQAAGGFAAVLNKGEADAGTILLVLISNGANPRVYDRMPTADGGRKWTAITVQDIDIPGELSAYLDRRKRQDSDLWIVELDVANAERLIGLTLAVD